MNELLLPFQLDFMRDAFVIAGLIAVPCALLSCFLVLKGWSLMGDAVSHAVLPGVVLAYILNIPLLIGAFVAGMSCALLTGFLTDHSRIKQDTVMGVVFSGMFGIGLVLYTWIESEVHLDHILFGNMLGGHVAMKVFAGFIVSLGAVASAGGIAYLAYVAAILAFGGVLALTALEFLVAFLQAFVFAVLTCVYLNDAVHAGDH